MNKSLQFFLLLTLCIALFGCKKEGPPGADGNANVTAGTIKLTNSDYTPGYFTLSLGTGSTMGIYARVVEVPLPGITEDVFNNGAVMVYMKVPSTLGGEITHWASLPHSTQGNTVGYQRVYAFTYETGKLKIYYYFLHTDSNPTSPIPSISTVTVPTQDFKYVIFGGKPAGAGFIQTPAVNILNYDAVKNYYRLPE